MGGWWDRGPSLLEEEIKPRDARGIFPLAASQVGAEMGLEF